ncbi:MAG: hypothetical protein ABIR24_07595 [Verrucomicrobiota bacterium]
MILNSNTSNEPKILAVTSRRPALNLAAAGFGVITTLLLGFAPTACLGVAAVAISPYCAPSGQYSYQFVVYVQNVGTVTLTNIVVVLPFTNVLLATAAILPPGAGIVGGRLFSIPANTCFATNFISVFDDRNIFIQTTAVCAIATSPAIVVTKICPASPITIGSPLVFSGVVSNAGNSTLNNIVVSDDRAGTILSVATLAPGRTTNYAASYTPTNCGPNVASTVTVRGTAPCSGIVVSNSVTGGCQVFCPATPTVLLNPAIQAEKFVFSFATESNRQYRVEYAASFSPSGWQTLTNFFASNSVTVIKDVMTAQRFYRVVTP